MRKSEDTGDPLISEVVRSSRPGRRLHGRRQGRPLNAERRQALETLLPSLDIRNELENAVGTPLNPASLFEFQPDEVWLEIGFGNGEHLAAVMQTYPKTGFIGAEPFKNGMAAFLKIIQDKPHNNVRVLMDDALHLVKSITPGTLDGIYILNPDPWPKKKHHKRRIVSSGNLDLFAAALKPGGHLIMSTDVDALADWMIIHTYNHPAFKWTAQNAGDWEEPPKNWLKTRYEEKGEKAGRRQSYFSFLKR